jgi:hypothetical protein
MDKIELLEAEYVEAEEVEAEVETDVEDDLGSLPVFVERSGQNKLILIDSLFIESLEKTGFFTVKEGDNIRFVFIHENIIRKVIPDDIKRHVLYYVEKFLNRELKDLMIKNGKFFTQSYLSALKRVEPQILRDTKDTAYFPYRNGVVQVTKEGLSEPIPYREFGLLVWEHHIIDRDFIRNDLYEVSVFSSFLFRLTNNDQVRYNYLCSIIGYALHNYRTSANTKAIVINDENISCEPEGGSGKGILAKSLGFLRNQVVKDGKTFNPKRSFEYSDVDESTDLVWLDETSGNFNFEDLFSVITDGITIEKKFGDKRRLLIEKSPLFIITTNNVVKGYGGSFRRRQYNVDIHQYFNQSYTPEEEFGHTFFNDWDRDEWRRFDNFMLSCVYYYLNNRIVKLPEEFSRKKDAVRATNETFYEWFEEAKYDFQNQTSTSEALERYVEETEEELTSKKFITYIKSCSEILGHRFIQERTSEMRGFRLILN